MSDPRQHIMPVYLPPEEAFERGEGVRLITEQGKSYLDFVAGIAVSALGHSHPAMGEAFPKIYHAVVSAGMEPAGMPLARYFDFGEQETTARQESPMTVSSRKGMRLFSVMGSYSRMKPACEDDVLAVAAPFCRGTVCVVLAILASAPAEASRGAI